jgi:SAM-dependent methyltransferase
VADYYTTKLHQFGPVAQGVDWNSPASQNLRFEQLLKLCDGAPSFSINDFGCGYGALLGMLVERGWQGTYVGYDVAPAMVASAQALHAGARGATFTAAEADLAPADFTVASGIFNVRMQTPQGEWQAYVLDTLARLAALSRKGFAFNVLTSYSDADRMRPDLYYADPCFLFDHCKRRYSRHVALLHDYGLYEFTILVRL